MLSWYLKKLIVTNFRNLDNGQLEFSSKINCIFGSNGNGKTNLLEAIYFLIRKKSFKKNTTFSQMLSIDATHAEILIQALFAKNEEIASVSTKINLESSQWFINNELTKKKFPTQCVFVNPFDANQFHSNVSFRRDWFDDHFSILSDDYKHNLNRYEKFLKNRNFLLAEKPKLYLEQIKAIDLEFSTLIENLTNQRLILLKEVEEHLSSIFSELFAADNKLTLSMNSKYIGKTKNQILSYLNDNLQKESDACHTLNGPHRDEFIVLFDGLNAFDYCSLGQQKMAFLSLIFAYIELFRYKFMAYPIVLVDDVSGELDQMRWKNLINFLEGRDFQVFITTANEHFKNELEKIQSAKKFEVTQGAVLSY
jgi:DNA replication and repair protein RecF